MIQLAKQVEGQHAMLRRGGSAPEGERGTWYSPKAVQGLIGERDRHIRQLHAFAAQVVAADDRHELDQKLVELLRKACQEAVKELPEVFKQEGGEEGSGSQVGR